MQQLSLGEAAPQVSSTTGVCWTSLDSSPSTGGAGERQEGLCAGVEWTSTTLAIQVRLTFAEGKAVTLLVSGIQLSGMVRIPAQHSNSMTYCITICIGQKWSVSAPHCREGRGNHPACPSVQLAISVVHLALASKASWYTLGSPGG